MSSPVGTVSTDDGILSAFIGACNQFFGICPTAMKVIVMSEAKIVGGHGMSLRCNSVYVGLIAADIATHGPLGHGDIANALPSLGEQLERVHLWILQGNQQLLWNGEHIQCPFVFARNLKKFSIDVFVVVLGT